MRREYSAAEVNMLRCAVRGRLSRSDWTTHTAETLAKDWLIELDGPWMHITADGRNVLVQIEEAL